MCAWSFQETARMLGWLDWRKWGVRSRRTEDNHWVGTGDIGLAGHARALAFMLNEMGSSWRVLSRELT